MANRLRRLVIQMTTAAGSGHPTSCMSCAEIVSTLFFHEMRWDPTDPRARNVDTFILSKGHAAPILWAALHEAGAIRDDLMTLRKKGSPLEGHPMPSSPWVRIATGSLGQGLSGSAGIALANRLDRIDARVFCLLGDGEASEGSVWEAAQFASLKHLNNLVAIIDMNALGQSGPAPYRHDGHIFARRFESFGWKTVMVDGHDTDAVLGAFEQAHEGGPTAIIARTEKGKGVSFLEGAEGWHGKPLPAEDAEKALAEIGEADPHLTVEPRRLGDEPRSHTNGSPRLEVSYEPGQMVATRDAYGTALVKLGKIRSDVVVLDGDVSNSTRAEGFAKEFPDRFFECYIAEQNMIGAALGLGVSGKIPFASSFACFLTRGYDQIRMAGHSQPPHLILCGSHAGVSIGEDGPSQMGLEDLAMMRAVLESKVLYPCDAVSAERLTALAAETEGLVYIRTSRPKTPVIYDNHEEFHVGGSKTLRSSGGDRVTIVAAGVTLHEALRAHDILGERGIAARVLDVYSVKPIDAEALAKAARETGRIIVVEDHSIHGGLGEAVAAEVGSLAEVHRLGVTETPRSATPEELLEEHGISAGRIAQRAVEIAG